MMDREKKDELPLMQVGFIDFICSPLYKSLSESFPWIKPLYEGCMANRAKWQELSEMVEMGLTWVNSDTIEGAIAENATASEKVCPEKVILTSSKSTDIITSEPTPSTAVKAKAPSGGRLVPKKKKHHKMVKSPSENHALNSNHSRCKKDRSSLCSIT